MGRKQQFGDDVRKRAIELRGRGMVTADIIVTLKNEHGVSPGPNWVNEATRGVSSLKVDVATATARAAEMVAQVESQDPDSKDVSDDALRAQLKALGELQLALFDNPSALSQLSGAVVRTVQAIDKRTPPPPPAKEEDPDWVQAAEMCKQKLRSELQKMIDGRLTLNVK